MKAHLCSFLTAAALLAGCAERSTPTEPAATAPAVRLNRQAGTTQGAVPTFTIRIKKNGKSKAYHVRPDKEARKVEFTTLAFQCSDPEDPACEPEPCDHSMEYCNTAEFIDEELDGGQVGIGDVSDTSEAAACPETINGGVWFSWRGHSFVTWGVHTRQRVLRSWPWAEAEYALPPGPHESMDGKAVIWNGVLRGKCWGDIDRYGDFHGVIVLNWLRGEAQETQGSGGGGGSVFYTVSNGTLTTTTNGVMTGDATVDEVINRWLETGECTQGWVIIVDSDRVC